MNDENDINKFIQKTINEPIPFSQPQWQVFIKEEYQEKYSLMIWKSHHSFCDGVSVMSLHLGMGDEYDLSKFIPIKKINFIQRIFIRLMFILYLPKIFIQTAFNPIDKNPLHDGKRQLSGRKLAANYSNLKFQEIKDASKKLNMTINDLITSCLASTVKQLFNEIDKEKKYADVKDI